MASRDEKLAALAAQEALKSLMSRVGAADPALVSAGWERRFVGDAQRVREAVELYEQLGWEVLTEAVRPADLPDACKDCALVAALAFQVIYTRRRPSPTLDRPSA